METVYQKIAKAALMKWHNLNEEEASTKVKTESFEILEKQINAMNSIKYAISEISKQLNLNNIEMQEFLNAVINGKNNEKIFELIKLKAKNMSNEQILKILSSIHDGWVKDNSNETIFYRKMSRAQLRQYAVLELIGFNEVESDLLFLIPILERIGIKIDIEILKDFYYRINKYYLEKEKINNYDNLLLLLIQGKKYYPILSYELEQKLKPLCNTVASQIIDNWYSSDTECARNFENNKNK